MDSIDELANALGSNDDDFFRKKKPQYDNDDTPDSSVEFPSEDDQIMKTSKETEEILLDAKNFITSYKNELGESLREGNNVAYVDFEEIMNFSPPLAEELVLNPETALRVLEQAVEESGIVDLTEKAGVRVRLKNMPDSHMIYIRSLRAKHLDNLILIEGIVRQASDVRPQVVNAKFECPSCGTVISVLQLEKKFREPTRCSCGRRGGFKVTSKEMVDTQRLILEEPPESLSGGEQPKRINVFVKEDLVEPRMEKKTTPGSQVKVIGILKEVPVPLPSGGMSTRFELAVEVNNLIPMEETFDDLLVNEEDEIEIKELAADPQIFDKLAASIAPSVWGHESIKKAMTLQLFGGVQKEKTDGSKTRGDLHLLLIGDPGVAKSVMLGFMAGISPKGRYVVGKSASGAGLTATVVKDEYLKGWALEAGAMVLCNKGLVCIDELEKMDPQDRSAMHEAMEQQTVTISKANVQATLRAQTSVLAAANPKFGTFDPFQSIPQQIDLPPTLLNRFDLMFILRDLPDWENDEKIANHILQMQRAEGATAIIEPELYRKYVAYAKQKVKPALTDESILELKSFYVSLRNSAVNADSETRNIPISARQLTALVRMSEATAKIRLSETVDKCDTDIAIGLMKGFLSEVGKDPETGKIDINRFAAKVGANQKNKIMLVRDAIEAIEGEINDKVPLEKIIEKLEDKVKVADIEEALTQLRKSGDIFEPQAGFFKRL